MIASVFIALVLTLCASSAQAFEPCAPTDKHREWSSTCFSGTGDARRVKPAFLERIRVNAYGMATILIVDPHELIAVNQNGQVIISNIFHAGDFDYPHAYLGIGRFSVAKIDGSGKLSEYCGYFLSRELKILVPARFDHCQPFDEQGAIACTGCISYCTDIDCKHRMLVDGQAFELREDGSIRRQFSLRTRFSACDQPDAVRITPLEHGELMLRCATTKRDPFKVSIEG